MHYHEPDCLPKRLVVFKIKVTVEDHIIKILPSDISSTADPFATEFGLIAHHHKLDCLCEKICLHCCGQGHRKG